MKRTFALTLVALAAAALFGGLVHGVLAAAHVSEPAATTVYGLTVQETLGHHGRCRWRWSAWSSVGWLWPAPIVISAPLSGRLGAIVALVAGLIAVVNGGLVLAVANGGPGTGNGVVGGAVALVLGLIATVLAAGWFGHAPIAPA